MIRPREKQALSRCRQQALDIQSERQALEAKLMSPAPLVKGCLVVTRKVCGKSGCRCATSKRMRHGPFMHLSVLRQGKTRKIHLPKRWEDTVRAGVEAARRYRQARRQWLVLEKRMKSLWKQVERYRNHLPYEPKPKGS
jgi:hypothetical protein